MAKIDVPGVHKVTSKGKTYFYAWRGGPRLKAEPGTAAFIQEIADHQAKRRLGDQSKVSGLVALYRSSDRWQLPREKGGLSPTTKKQWAPWLDRIQDHFGGLSIRQFDRPEIRQHIKRWRDRWKATPRTADMGKQVLSAVLSFAVDEGKLGSNPCLGIKNLYSNDRSDRIWTPDDLAKLAEKASAEVVWAAKLAALTGLRQSDLLKLSWSHVGALSIEMRTGKSGGKKTTLIPLYAELKAVLDGAPRRATTVLTNSEGLPWKSGFGSSWNKALKNAGLADADLHFHDLRGTAATRMYVAGLTIREIAEVMTWSEDEVERLIDRYVKRDEILRDRIRRMDSAQAPRDSDVGG